MEQGSLDYAIVSAKNKLAFFSNNNARYIVYAIFAGCFCSLGMAFAYSVGAGVYNSPSVAGMYKLAIGVAFALSFTLIIFAGGELFTSNVMVMTIAVLDRSIQLRRAAGLLLICYISNIFGAIFMGGMFAATGLLDGSVGELLVSSCMAKTSITFSQGVFRGILCNVLVCLGIWIVYKLKSESAKMIAIIWVVTGFVTPGYEHSIANAGLFTMAALTPNAATQMTMARALGNLVPVTLGNLIGGSLLVGLGYWFAGRKGKE